MLCRDLVGATDLGLIWTDEESSIEGRVQRQRKSEAKEKADKECRRRRPRLRKRQKKIDGTEDDRVLGTRGEGSEYGIAFLQDLVIIIDKSSIKNYD